MSVDESGYDSNESPPTPTKNKKSGKSRFIGMMRGMGGYSSSTKKKKLSNPTKTQRFTSAIRGAFGQQ
jgi:hypothetical protein